MNAQNMLLYEWFAESAKLHPDQPALEIADRVVGYAELEGMAEHLAVRLLAANDGVAPRRVGLLATANAVFAYAGYLAVQRLGAAVVPLNPTFPTARNAAIARAAGLDLVLTGQEWGGTDLATRTLVVDPAEPGEALPADELPELAAGQGDLAYVLFTSGSTGEPKGVPIRHRNISAYLGHSIRHYELGPGCRVLQPFDLTFDLSVLTTFAALGSGATVVVPGRNDLLAAARFVQRRELTHWFSVPSVISLTQRVAPLLPGSMPTLRRSMFAGEALTLQQAEAWHAAAPNGVVENGYGPTELTIICAEYVLPAQVARWPRTHNGTVPIGPGLPSLDCVVLDAGGRQADEGELCVRGPQRFAGYLDPAHNEGRFLTYDGDVATPHDPVTPLTDEQWYRTGDRVRVSADGYVYCERLDHQVKVRGYRVELGEVEAVLREQPGVRDAVVVARPAPGGDAVLAAACTGLTGDTGALLEALREKLPAYMVPASLTVFEEFPLNVNGKVDRRRLAEALS
ncbi:amino acid adenylation domain-containing protein [Lentzea sp. HUAS12]|uniref:amino acid adenylation domain-containing protein n=1 Tax=Lentzea sp. HUAS12 TaxID=2951806 RepID=UPI0020A0B653|nr:amino acid adenylation domain-containing protein [Lentzea sp. HUAS12]USX53521.1 amino acid adenylation domain-containing protein [Lentzea sp. HUAS12]